MTDNSATFNIKAVSNYLFRLKQFFLKSNTPGVTQTVPLKNQSETEIVGGVSIPRWMLEEYGKDLKVGEDTGSPQVQHYNQPVAPPNQLENKSLTSEPCQNDVASQYIVGNPDKISGGHDANLVIQKASNIILDEDTQLENRDVCPETNFENFRNFNVEKCRQTQSETKLDTRFDMEEEDVDTTMRSSFAFKIMSPHDSKPDGANNKIKWRQKRPWKYTGTDPEQSEYRAPMKEPKKMKLINTDNVESKHTRTLSSEPKVIENDMPKTIESDRIRTIDSDKPRSIDSDKPRTIWNDKPRSTERGRPRTFKQWQQTDVGLESNLASGYIRLLPETGKCRLCDDDIEPKPTQRKPLKNREKKETFAPKRRSRSLFFGDYGLNHNITRLVNSMKKKGDGITELVNSIKGQPKPRSPLVYFGDNTFGANTISPPKCCNSRSTACRKRCPDGSGGESADLEVNPDLVPRSESRNPWWCKSDVDLSENSSIQDLDSTTTTSGFFDWFKQLKDFNSVISLLDATISDYNGKPLFKEVDSIYGKLDTDISEILNSDSSLVNCSSDLDLEELTRVPLSLKSQLNAAKSKKKSVRKSRSSLFSAIVKQQKSKKKRVLLPNRILQTYSKNNSRINSPERPRSRSRSSTRQNRGKYIQSNKHCMICPSNISAPLPSSSSRSNTKLNKSRISKLNQSCRICPWQGSAPEVSKSHKAFRRPAHPNKAMIPLNKNCTGVFVGTEKNYDESSNTEFITLLYNENIE